MAVLWQYSLTPRIAPNGAPYSGAKAYFFDVGTTTPQVAYTDAALSIPHDHPVVADSAGVFPAVFFEDESSHRMRLTTSADVTLHDVDNISVPTTTPPEFPDSETPTEKTIQTGHIIMAWRSSAPNGFVRCNGRTIGAAASGATERANADAQPLYVFLWNNDSSLAVSGGRGATADGDWAANKQIALPDFRGRAPAGLDSFGNAAANRITDAQLGTDSDTLGGAGGAAAHTLTTAQMPSHTHTGTTSSDGAHTHTSPLGTSGNTGSGSGDRYTPGANVNLSTTSNGAHTHTITTDGTGSGEAHNNLQPTLIVPFFIKL